MATKKITIELSDANAWMLDNVAKVLNTTKSELISLCLKVHYPPFLRHGSG